MKYFVLGFAFNVDSVSGKTTSVLLIRKNKPEWQRGLLNGIGGKIESFEDAYTAISREFKEECGIYVQPGKWKHTITIHGNEWTVYVYRTFLLDSIGKEKTLTSEPVQWVSIDDINRKDAIKNLSWLVPIQFDSLVFPISITDTCEIDNG